MTLRDLLARLDGVRDVTGGHVARCPVPRHGKGNGDKNASLSISERDGKILLHYFAGCRSEDIVRELDLEWKCCPKRARGRVLLDSPRNTPRAARQTVMPRANEMTWTLADSTQPAASHVAEDVGPPSGLTASRADLVTWWRWRYAAIEADNARMNDRLVQALGESQAYREMLQVALDTQREQAGRHRHLCEQHRRLQDEYRSHREAGLRDEPGANRRNEV